MHTHTHTHTHTLIATCAFTGLEVHTHTLHYTQTLNPMPSLQNTSGSYTYTHSQIHTDIHSISDML